jgi:hypothetical protein
MKQVKESFIESYAEALALHFNVPTEGLHGRQLVDYVILTVLLRADETSVELMHLMRKTME